jgi:hypothetical protein
MDAFGDVACLNLRNNRHMMHNLPYTASVINLFPGMESGVSHQIHIPSLAVPVSEFRTSDASDDGEFKQ